MGGIISDTKRMNAPDESDRQLHHVLSKEELVRRSPVPMQKARVSGKNVQILG